MAATSHEDRSGLLDVLEADPDSLVSASIKIDAVVASDGDNASIDAGQIGDSEIHFDRDDDTASVSSVQTRHDQQQASSDTESVTSTTSTDPLKLYPHWEKQLLSDKVTLQPRNDMNRNALASRLSLASSASASAGEVTSGEYRTAASSASSIAEADKDETFSTYTSPFAHSFGLPNLPLATHFPPFAPQAQLLKRASDASLPSLSRSFATKMYTPLHPSTMRCMPGVDNQFQGPLQEKCIWRSSAHSDEPDDFQDKKSFLDFTVTEDLAVDDVDALHDCVHVKTKLGAGADLDRSEMDEEELRQLILQQWPLLGQIRRPYPVTDALPSRYMSSAPSIADSDSACTCGHHQYLLRAPPSTAVEYIDAHIADAFTRDAGARSQSSTRAVASLPSSGDSDGTSVVDSRTSSEMYLSPNYPDRESGSSGEYSSAQESFVTGSSMTTGTDTSCTDLECEDGHRVHHSPQNVSGSDKAGSRFRGFLRRVSGMGRKASNASQVDNDGQSTYVPDQEEPLISSTETFSSIRPRAPSPPSPTGRPDVADRGRSYTIRPLDDSALLTPRASQKTAREDVNCFPVPASRQTCEDHLNTSTAAAADGIGRPSPRRRLTTGGPGFVRRLSAQLRFPSFGGPSTSTGGGNKVAPITGVSDASASATPESFLPSRNDMGAGSNGGKSGNGDGGKESGRLFRNFKLSGPRARVGGQR